MRQSTETAGRPDEDSGSLQIETEGRGRIAEISASARRVPWFWNLLQVLWVAGPATFLAMQGGYWLGFGEFAPARNVIYFAFFTLFLGVIALGSKFVSVAITERRAEEAAQALRRTIDWLPELLFAIRDADLAADSTEDRRRRAAGALLQELDLGPETLALAVRELSGDIGLAQIAQQIEVYRRVGLHSRVRDLVEASTEARLAALERAHAEVPELADLLRERLSGRAPSQGSGIPRREGFLQRLLAAAEQDDPGALPVADVQELLVLLFELVNGREIRYLRFSWKGSWNVARALSEVEIKRTRHRLAQARVDSRLRGLARLLAGTPGSGLRHGDLSLDTVTLGQRVLLALETLVAARPRPGSAAAKRLARLLHEVHRLHEDHARWLKAGQAFDTALAYWERMHQRVQPERRRWWQRLRGRGLQIQEDVIDFSNERKLAFAREFCRVMDEAGIQFDERGLQVGGQAVDRGEIRRLGLHLLTLLQESLDLSDLAIQRAIQAAPAAWLGGLQAGMTADGKAGLGAAVVKEVRQDLGRMAERLAAQLATLYQLPLSEALRQRLVERYGANPERLEMLASRVGEGSGQPLRRAQPSGREALMRDPRWALLLKFGDRYLD
ncbi:hypothetical protein [Thioalkalivibrio sp.]|uniref:hypothetical protein n=1 Tax=Thioalkalivibrio sp. TaxID=2093813 RepID=UPI0012D6723E|nr:hypothetical protein [Thioalkalivibrio sp.]TVP83332.1 MAG: hypothetical protein EA346_00680 [Thioalkalivibrio sp.]